MGTPPGRKGWLAESDGRLGDSDTYPMASLLPLSGGRTSPSPEHMTRTWSGFIKVKLLHREGASVLLPELVIMGTDGDLWVQPQFFFAPLLQWHEDSGRATVWVGALDRTRQVGGGLDLTVTLGQTDRVAALDDRSEIYGCEISTEHSPATLAVGRARGRSDGGFDVALFHHTTEEALALIHESGHLQGSAWNFQGTRKLENVAYAYFTSMSQVTCEEDLQNMAMASIGGIPLQLDTNLGHIPDLFLKVYRASTRDRNATLKLWVPAEAISTPHIWKRRDRSIYYEIAHPWIHRIGLRPGRHLDFADGTATPASGALRRFGYAVLGDCSTLAGLVAPYDEENTAETFRVQSLEDTNLFDFWVENANTDLYVQPLDKQTFSSRSTDLV